MCKQLELIFLFDISFKFSQNSWIFVKIKNVLTPPNGQVMVTCGAAVDSDNKKLGGQAKKSIDPTI